MKSKKYINNFAVFCDSYGNIMEVLSKGEFESNVNVGDNLYQYINTDWSNKYFEFLQILRAQGYFIGCEINLYFENNDYSMTFNGIYKNEGLYIVVLHLDQDINDILKEILEMNSHYVTQLRNNIKTHYLYVNNIDEMAYEEIARLNNELVNSKRVIEQQNAKLKEYNKSLEELALKDSLTDAFNRRYFNFKIIEEIEKLRTTHSNIILVYIDFDNFKLVNDKLGHSAGDELLKSFGNICKETLREGLDFTFRLGGDEFLIMSVHQNKEKLINTMECINKKFKTYTEISELSYGFIEIISEEINDDDCIEKYLREVDKKMYEFKNNKKTRVFHK